MKIVALAILAATLALGLWGAFSAAKQMQHAIAAEARAAA